jgi:hypothetical protein
MPMLRLRLFPIAVLLLALVAPSARAFFDPPWITPAAPSAGEVISVNIQSGGCDAIIFKPGYPQITRSDNSIHIVEYGIHDAPSGFCIYPLGMLTETIGTVPPGDYTLTVDLTYDAFPSGEATITLGVIAFSVAGATTSAVPSLSTSGRLSLAVLVLGAALGALGKRSRNGLSRP